MTSARSADIIDFVSAAKRLRLLRRRHELQSLRASYAARMQAPQAAAAWTWFAPPGTAFAPGPLSRHGVAR